MSAADVKKDASPPPSPAGSGCDNVSVPGSDASTVARMPAASMLELHAALTATVPTFPAYSMRATAAAPSKGRGSYVRRFCRVLHTSTLPLAGQPLRTQTIDLKLSASFPKCK